MTLKNVFNSWYPRIIFAVGLIITVYAITWIVPFQASMPREGLDPSWKSVIEHSLLNQLTFGEDIIFTYGPLGFLSTKQFQQNLYPILLIYWLLVTASISLLFYSYYRLGNPLVTIITYLLVLISVSLNANTALFILPVLFALSQANTKPYRLEVRLTSHLLIVLCGIACLVKGTAIFLILPVFLMLDIKSLIKEKSLPKMTLLLVSTILVAFFLSGQPLSKIGIFFLGILEISKGYSSAMQKTGSFSQIFIFLGLVVMLGSLMITQLFRKKINWDDSIVFLSLIIFLFLSFKQGFVRHDGHAITAGASILVATSLLAAYFNAKKTFNSLRIISLITILLSLVFFLYILNFYANMHPQKLLKSKFIYQPVSALKRVKSLFLEDGFEDLEERRSKAIKNIANKHQLPKLEGSVDIFPWDQAILLANNLDYNPRPIFQSYSVYTPNLIKKNIEHLNSSEAADYLLFDIKTIGGRYPTLDDGALWPTIWRNYDPVGYSSGFLVLDRRSLPRKISLNEISKASSEMGQYVILPEVHRPIWTKMKIHMSPLGKLLTLAFKQSILKIEVTFNSGRSEIKSLVPSMASEGFLLSPYITEEKEFAALLLPSSTEGLFARHVIKVRILESKITKLFFKKEVYWEFSEVSLARDFTEPMTEELRQQLEWLSIRGRMLALNDLDPYVSVRKEDLIAHAPTSLKLPFLNSEQLYVKFGIRDRAWQEGNTDGVLFAISLLNSSEEKVEIWSRLLQPKQISADRGEQVAIIDLPEQGGILIFETRPHGNTARDWSYWSRVTFK